MCYFEGMSLEETLTSRQLEVLNAIKDHMEKTGSAPSTGELAQSLGIARSSIPGHLEALEKKRALEKVGKRYRVTELFSDDYFVLRSSIAAGIPTESVDDVEGEPLKFDRGYFGGGEIEPVRICGESMCGDSIHDGDIAMIRLGKDLSLIHI